MITVQIKYRTFFQHFIFISALLNDEGYLRGIYYLFISAGVRGQLGVSVFFYLSAGAVEWESPCFVTNLLHHAPAKVTSVLVLFIIFGRLFFHWFIGV